MKSDGYKWTEDLVLLLTLTRACRLQNDVFHCHLPIHKGLFELILFELQRIYDDQVYLRTLFSAVFCLAYYGLMRVGELAAGDHPVHAKDMHIGTNKNKILLVLCSSKTHTRAQYLQEIKITAQEDKYSVYTSTKQRGVFFCPFLIVRSYLHLRGNYTNQNENFFIFGDKSVVRLVHVRNILTKCLNNLNLDSCLYGTHSFRIGRCCDLIKEGTPIEDVKRLGRWHSNAIYKYLCTL